MLNDCAVAILYHFADIAQYWEQLGAINQCYQWHTYPYYSFLTIALVGIRILKSFYQLSWDKKTNYSIFLTSFPKLHEKLKSTLAETLLVLQHIRTF